MVLQQADFGSQLMATVAAELESLGSLLTDHLDPKQFLVILDEGGVKITDSDLYHSDQIYSLIYYYLLDILGFVIYSNFSMNIERSYRKWSSTLNLLRKTLI